MNKPPAARTSRDDIILTWAIIGLSVLLSYYLIYICRRVNHGHFGDFPTFYDAGRAVRNHADPYIPEVNGMAYVYPPLFAVMCTPLTHLSMPAAEKVFLFINVGCLLASLLVGARAMLRRLGVPMTAPAVCLVALLAGVLVENDMRGELQAMETDVLILLMFTLALHWLDDRPVSAGAALGFAMNIKYLTILALPYLLLRRRWRAAGGMVGGTIGFGLLPGVVIGWRENLRCLSVALGGLLGWVGKAAPRGTKAHVHGIADGLSVSVTSAFARALRMHQLPQSYSLILAAGLGLVLLMGAWLLYRRNGLPMWDWPGAGAQGEQPFAGLVALEWAALIVVTLTFSPDTNTRHLSMVALVYACAATMLLFRRAGAPWWPLLAGTLVAFVGLIMPVKALVSTPVLQFYFRWSFCSWSLLVMYALLLYAGLRYVALGTGSPEVTTPRSQVMERPPSSRMI